MTKIRSASDTMVGGELLRAMTGEVEPALHADEQRAVGRGRVVPRARARARDVEIRNAAVERRSCARALRPAGSGRCCRCRQREGSSSQASPMRSGTLSRNLAAEIAPGRITRGCRPVQSTTVDG